jgi:hypothetical protein
MSFKAVWGFDPEEVAQAQRAFRSLPYAEEPEPMNATDECIGIPSSAELQLSELQRMFRL